MSASPLSMILTLEEVEFLITSLLYGRENGRASDDEIKKLVAWAEDARINDGLLKNVLEGNLLPLLDKDGEIGFTCTPKGLESAENLIRTLAKRKEADNEPR